jgi:Heparinase II/III-like protein/Domain of unknown function (DUF4962)
MMLLGSTACPLYAISEAEALAAHERAKKIDHPRFFNDPSGKRILDALQGERAAAVKELLGRVGRQAGKPLTAPSLLRSGPSTKSDPHGAQQATTQLNQELNLLPEFAIAWLLTKDPRWKTEVSARLESSVSALEEVAGRPNLEVVQLRNLVGAIALVLDIAHDVPSAELQARSVGVIGKSIARAKSLVLNNTANASPDMANYHSLAILCGASILLAGEFEGSASFVQGCMPAYLNYLSPIRGADGFYQGSSYAIWTVDPELMVLDIFQRVGGVDTYKLKWVQGFSEFIAYTLPPGAAAGAFGDGAEVRRTDEQASFAQELAARIDTPLMRWYAASQPANLWWQSLGPVLLRPVQGIQGAAAFPDGSRDSKLFPSVGVAALHSSLQRSDRISVLFRSSAFGAEGHAHADQNSFVLSVGDESVLIDSGVYDWYGSPHWRQWYHQTRAHNAITYNGGQGQHDGPAAGTVIRGFGDDGRVATLTGEAAAAYGPDVKRAMRTIVFIRPNTLLIYDVLSATGERVWELNFHTKRSVLKKDDAQAVTLQGGGAPVCISVVSGPQLRLLVSKGYPVQPDTPTKGEESNIRFETSGPTKEGRILSVVQIGCDLSRVQSHSRTGGVDAVVDGTTFSFSDEGVRYRSK